MRPQFGLSRQPQSRFLRNLPVGPSVALSGRVFEGSLHRDFRGTLQQSLSYQSDDHHWCMNYYYGYSPVPTGSIYFDRIFSPSRHCQYRYRLPLMVLIVTDAFDGTSLGLSSLSALASLSSSAPSCTPPSRFVLSAPVVCPWSGDDSGVAPELVASSPSGGLPRRYSARASAYRTAASNSVGLEPPSPSATLVGRFAGGSGGSSVILPLINQHSAERVSFVG